MTYHPFTSTLQPSAHTAEDDDPDTTSAHGSTASSLHFDSRSDYTHDDQDDVHAPTASVAGAAPRISKDQDSVIVVRSQCIMHQATLE